MRERTTHLERPTIDLTRYRKRYKPNEKGRPPQNRREQLLDEIAKLTKTSVPRWCRYPETALEKALIDFKEAREVRSKTGLMTFLLKKHTNHA